VLAQNPNYNLTDKPLLKRIVIKIIGDINQINAQLRSGALDAATYEAFPMPTEALNGMSSVQKVDYVPGRSWDRFDFNLDRPFFKDKAVRQAIAHALNRQQIADRVMLGKAPVAHTFLPPMSWASMQNPDFQKAWQDKFPLKSYAFDQARANQILDQAGWARGADGVRAKGDVRLTLDLAAPAGRKMSEQILQLAQQDLKAIGIEARTRLVSASQYTSDGGYLARRRHDLALVDTTVGLDPSGAPYDSQSIPSEQNGYKGTNYAGYRNDKFDQLSRAAASDIDRARRSPIFAEMQAIWSEELPSIPLYVRPVIEVHKPNLINWEVSAGTTPSTSRASAMYFK
jgi:peptide/nickel transport system substrate-binding protein